MQNIAPLTQSGINRLKTQLGSNELTLQKHCFWTFCCVSGRSAVFLDVLQISELTRDWVLQTHTGLDLRFMLLWPVNSAGHAAREIKISFIWNANTETRSRLTGKVLAFIRRCGNQEFISRLFAKVFRPVSFYLLMCVWVWERVFKYTGNYLENFAAIRDQICMMSTVQCKSL